MPDVLRKYSEIGTRDEVAYLLCNIVGSRTIPFEDIRTLCSHVHGGLKLRPDALVDFLQFSQCLSLDTQTGMVSLSSRYVDLVDHADEMIRAVVFATLDRLFANGIMTAELFSYCRDRDIYVFNNERLTLDWSAIRNLLISCGFLTVRVLDHRTIFEVPLVYEEALEKLIRTHHKSITLERLKAEMLSNEEAGELAEQFALRYEKQRLKDPERARRVKRISMIDVCAGYDIASFEGPESTTYDRLVEVKAVSKGCGFYWSRNEIETARLAGERYHLFLVDLNRIDDSSYEPRVIADPAGVVLDSQEWLLEPQSFYVCQVFRDRE